MFVKQNAVETQNKPVLSPIRPQNLSARFVWGSLVANLRSLNLMTLHTACGEIRDVELNGNVLTVLIKEEYLYNILKREETYAQILKIIKSIEGNLELNFVLAKKQEDKVKINLQKLQNIFGSDLIVK